MCEAVKPYMTQNSGIQFSSNMLVMFANIINVGYFTTMAIWLRIKCSKNALISRIIEFKPQFKICTFYGTFWNHGAHWKRVTTIKNKIFMYDIKTLELTSKYPC